MTTTTDNGTVVTTGSAPSSWRVHPPGGAKVIRHTATDLTSPPSRKLSSLLPPLIDDEEEEDPDRHLRPEVVREHSPDTRGFRPTCRHSSLFPGMGLAPSTSPPPPTTTAAGQQQKQQGDTEVELPKPDVVRSHSSTYLSAKAAATTTTRHQMSAPPSQEEEEDENQKRLLTRISSLKVVLFISSCSFIFR